jgi:hypothetical protein
LEATHSSHTRKRRQFEPTKDPQRKLQGAAPLDFRRTG